MKYLKNKNMLNRITAYYRTHKRNIKKYTRTTFTRPIKDKLHNYQIYLIREITDIKATFFQIKNLRFLWIFVIFFWLFRDFAFAAGTTEPTKIDPLAATVDTLNWILSVVVIIAKPLVMFIWRLLSPDWTFWDIIWLRPVLHQIWIYVSNVVYFIFAIMLVAIALMNIFSENASFALKKSLPKLIIWILMVPFTWFIVSATLSVANVLTASVLTIPFDTIMTTQTNNNLQEALDKIDIPADMTYKLNEWSGAFSTWNRKITLKQLLNSDKWAYNLVAVYAYWIFKIQDVKGLDKTTSKTVTSIQDLFKKLLTGTLFAIVFSILVIAITFALFTRMAMLWIFAMFSPLFALSFFLWWTKSKALEKLGKLSVTKFISLAMVPVYVSAALSFWLMFLSITQNSIKPGESKTIIACKNNKQDDCQRIEFWSMSLEIIWNWVSKWGEGMNTAVNAGTWFIANIIISILALIILWMAVMAALWADDITKSAVEPIAKFWWEMWQLMVNAPKYIPLKLPLWGKSVPISMAWLETLSSQIWSHIKDPARVQATEFAKAIWMGWSGSKTAMQEFRSQHKQADKNDWSITKQFVEKVKTQDSIRNIMASPELRNDFLEWLVFYLWVKNKDEFKKAASSDINSLAKALKDHWWEKVKTAFWTDISHIVNSLEWWNSNNPEWDPSRIIKDPKLYPDKVTKTDNNITISVSWSDDKWGNASRPITLNIADLKNGEKVKSIEEIVEILKKQQLEWEKSLEEIAKIIITKIKPSS